MTRAASPGPAVFLVALLATGCDRPASDGPVVLVTVDTTRADRIGSYGGTAVDTPAFDRLAREGVRVEDGISQVPLTLPAHASMFTGRYPMTHGVRHNGIYRLPDEETTLAERFRDAGYRTAGFVAAYVLNSGFGAEQGFADYDDVPVNRYAGGQDQLFLAERPASAVNARVFEWLDAQPDGRFFLWVHYYDPHDPYAPPEDEGLELQGEGYDREISYLDHRLGDLWRALESRGWWKGATVVLAGDHGESLGEHDEITHGLFLYEGAVRVPMMLKGPGLPRGRTLEGSAELVDLAPTILELAGLPALERAEGESLLPRIRGEQPSAGTVAYAETLMPKLEFGWSDLWMVRSGRFKYIEAPTPELYDLATDPAESDNLARFEPERTAELAGLLAEWRATAADAGAGAAERTLSDEEEAQLRSLGYLGGDFFKRGADGTDLPDPKDRIGEVRALDAARERLTDGDPEGALRGVDEILAASPGNHQARTTRILALIELERWPEAEEEALAALAAAVEDPDGGPVLIEKARGLLASVYQLSNRPDEAEEQYLKLLEADPDQVSAAVDLARLHLGQGEFEACRRWLDHARERAPGDAMAWSVELRLADRRGDDAGVLAAARRLAGARAGEAAALVAAGRALVRAGDPAAAASCYDAALEQPGEFPLDWLGEGAAAHLAAGQLDAAEAAFRRYAALRPSDPRPWGFLTRIALARGDTEAAAAASDEALRRDGRFVGGLLDRARAYHAAGETDESRRLFEDARRRNPRAALADPLAQELR